MQKVACFLGWIFKKEFKRISVDRLFYFAQSTMWNAIIEHVLRLFIFSKFFCQTQYERTYNVWWKESVLRPSFHRAFSLINVSKFSRSSWMSVDLNSNIRYHNFKILTMNEGYVEKRGKFLLTKIIQSINVRNIKVTEKMTLLFFSCNCSKGKRNTGTLELKDNHI